MIPWENCEWIAWSNCVCFVGFVFAEIGCWKLWRFCVLHVLCLLHVLITGDFSINLLDNTNSCSVLHNSEIQIFSCLDVNSILGLFHDVVVNYVANISEVCAANVFWVKVFRFVGSSVHTQKLTILHTLSQKMKAACSSEMSATSPTFIWPNNPRTELMLVNNYYEK
jgi:hypothetical protein